MSIICYKVKRAYLLLNWTLWRDFGNSSYTLSAPDIRAADDCELGLELFAPHWVMEEQILLAAFKHIKHIASPWTTLESCKPQVAKGKSASLDTP